MARENRVVGARNPSKMPCPCRTIQAILTKPRGQRWQTMSSRPLPDTPDTHSHLHRPPTNIISAHAPHNQVPQKPHAARLKSRPVHRNTPNQKKRTREPISHSSPHPHFSPGVAPHPANLGPPERGVKPKKRARRGKERSHGRNMPNPKKRVWTHISRSPHPPHYAREVVPHPTSGGAKLPTHCEPQVLKRTRRESKF